MSKTVKISLKQVKKIIHEQIEEQKFLQMNESQKKKFLLERVENILNILSGKTEDIVKQGQEFNKEEEEARTFSSTTDRLLKSLNRSKMASSLIIDINDVLKTLLDHVTQTGLKVLNDHHGDISSIVKSVSCLLIYMKTLDALFTYRNLTNLAKALKNSDNTDNSNKIIKNELENLRDKMEGIKFSPLGTYLQNQTHY